MSKREFLDKLRKALENDLSGQVVQDNVNYYSTYINEEIRKGRSEREVLEELGDPWAIAKNIVTSEEIKGNTQETYESYEPRKQQHGQEYDQGYEKEKEDRSLHILRLDTWWKKLILGLAVVGIIALIVTVIGGIISILAPIFIPLLCICLVIKLITGSRR